MHPCYPPPSGYALVSGNPLTSLLFLSYICLPLFPFLFFIFLSFLRPLLCAHYNQLYRALEDWESCNCSRSIFAQFKFALAGLLVNGRNTYDNEKHRCMNESYGSPRVRFVRLLCYLVLSCFAHLSVRLDLTTKH